MTFGFRVRATTVHAKLFYKPIVRSSSRIGPKLYSIVRYCYIQSCLNPIRFAYSPGSLYMLVCRAPTFQKVPIRIITCLPSVI